MRIGRGIGIVGTVAAAAVGLAGCVARTVPVPSVKDVVERSEEGQFVTYRGEESDANKLKVFMSFEYQGQEVLGESLTRYENPGTSDCTRVEASYFDFMFSHPAPLVLTDDGCNGSVEYVEMEGMDRLSRADGADMFDVLLPIIQADLEAVAGYSGRLRAWRERKGVE